MIELSQGMGSSSEEESLENQHQLVVEIFLILEDLKRFISPKQKNPVAQLVLPEISYLTQTTHQFFQVLGQFPHANLSANKIFDLTKFNRGVSLSGASA